MAAIPVGKIVTVLVIGAVLLIIICAADRIRRMLYGVRSTLSTVRALADAAEKSSTSGPTEKSLNDVTRMLLPLIQKDFPDFSWEDLKRKAENTINSVLKARAAGNIGCLMTDSDTLREAVRLAIEDDAANGVKRTFENVVIHRTAVSDYKNTAGRCEIRLMSSVGFTVSVTGLDGLKKKRAEFLASPHPVETVVTSTLVHVQIVNKISAGTKITGLSCPHCGAPLSAPDAKHCAFCGGALTQVNSRVWSLEAVDFQDITG